MQRRLQIKRCTHLEQARRSTAKSGNWRQHPCEGGQLVQETESNVECICRTARLLFAVTHYAHLDALEAFFDVSFADFDGPPGWQPRESKAVDGRAPTSTRAAEVRATL